MQINRPVLSTRLMSLTIVLLVCVLLLIYSSFAGAQTPIFESQTANTDIIGYRFDSAAQVTGNPRHVIDYDSFVWAVYAADAPTQPEGVGAPYALSLGERTISAETQSTIAQGWGMEQLVNRTAAVTAPDLHLIQLLGPTKVEWLQTMEAEGLEIVQYIPPFSYLVYGTTASAEAIANAPFTHLQIPFTPEFRVHPNYRTPDTLNTEWHVLLYQGADHMQFNASLAGLTGRSAPLTPIGDTWAVASIDVTDANVAAIAALPGVASVQPVPTDGGSRGEMSSQMAASNFAGLSIPPGYRSWLAGLGLNGNGVLVANVDEGIQEAHPDLVNRMVPCTGVSCTGNSSSHGTHTAGIIAGDGASGTIDSNGFERGLGVAPGAQMIEQYYPALYTQPGGVYQLMTESVQNGATISSNSWGPSGVPRGYDVATMAVDIGVRDADPAADGHQPLHYILAFMNGYGGTSSQGSPDEAKNLFSVGSTIIQANNGAQLMNFFSLSANTAHGPALDGRTIPHIVAPGCWVDSTTPTNNYGTKCGTSMAAPHVAGAMALFSEQYQATTGQNPSPALGKAAFTVVARDLAGNSDADSGTLGHPFDNKQGWGQLDMEAILDPTHPVVYWDQTDLLVQTGDSLNYHLRPAVPGDPLRIMLVWTDAPGHGLGGSTPAWNNDLNLTVQSAGNTYLGNVFGTDGLSTVGGSSDSMNNTEAVFLPSVTEPFTLTIEAANLTSDGVPGNSLSIDQDFALVCFNCVRPINGSISKSITPANITLGDNIYVTVDYNFNASIGQTYTFTLEDQLLPGTTVVSGSIQLNGVAYPSSLNNGYITVEHSQQLAGYQLLRLTYQLQSNGAAISGITHTSIAKSLAIGEDTLSFSSTNAKSVVIIVNQYYLPMIGYVDP